MGVASDDALCYGALRAAPMPEYRDSPFETLDSAYGFVSLLREAVDDAYGSILDEIGRAQQTDGAERRLDALRVVDHKLNCLRANVLASLILLNDLRRLERLLLKDSNDKGSATDES